MLPVLSALSQSSSVACSVQMSASKPSNPPTNIAITRDPPTHPIHFLQRDDSARGTIERPIQRELLEFDIAVHRNLLEVRFRYMLAISCFSRSTPEQRSPKLWLHSRTRASVITLKTGHALSSAQNRPTGLARRRDCFYLASV